MEAYGVRENSQTPLPPNRTFRRSTFDRRALSVWAAPLATILPFGAEHADARQVLGNMVEPRLTKNAKLQRELSAGQDMVWERRSGMLAPARRLPFQTDKLEALSAMWARGLALHHFGVAMQADCNVISGV